MIRFMKNGSYVAVDHKDVLSEHFPSVDFKFNDGMWFVKDVILTISQSGFVLQEPFVPAKVYFPDQREDGS